MLKTLTLPCCHSQVHVFDLSENKHEPLCEQKVVKRAKLTHVSFNQVTRSPYRPHKLSVSERCLVERGCRADLSFLHCLPFLSSQVDPIIIAGDDHGQVHSLKLSPNLRKVRTLAKTKKIEIISN